MKTTIDLPDGLFRRLKRAAARRKTTMRAIIQAALDEHLVAQERPRRPFKLGDGSVGGRGIVPGIQEGDWNAIRELIYAGRGG